MLCFSSQAIASALLGVGVSLLPAKVCRWIAFYPKVLTAKSVLRAFYLGQITKIALLVTLMILVFIVFPVQPVVFFVAFACSEFLHRMIFMVLS